MQIEYTQDSDPCQSWYIPTADFRVFGELAQIQYTDFLVVPEYSVQIDDVVLSGFHC